MIKLHELRQNFAILLEAARETGAASDAEGKLHELLTGYYFNKGKHVDSYREEGKTPQEVHDQLKSAVSPETYDRINKHAEEMAYNLHHHLREEGFRGKVSKVAWTSQTKDVEHFTGKPDPNNESDIMVELKHASGSNKPSGSTEHVGFSMKYANNAPTLKNKTPKTLGETYGFDHKKIMHHHETHMENVRKQLKLGSDATGTEMHAKYKELRGTPKGDSIERTSHASRVAMIGDLHKHLSSMSPEELHKHVLNHIAGPTNSRVLMASTTSTGQHHIIDTREHYNSILKEHAKHLAVKKGEGTTLSITGKGGKPLLNIQAVNKGRPTKTPEFIAKPGASLMGK